ncbi:hypothetical protein BGZ63DRAFT_457557 [Mariannaea sp. PMI_226]|nr:hypothetical protein BGZ63DRAFT_457557 [Mariannaea sp. PMI_226]
MKTFRNGIVAGLFVVVNTRHLLQSIPVPTHNFQLPEDGVSPRPTSGAMELFPRSIDAFSTVTLLAPENTCGFINGSFENWVTCAKSLRCGFLRSSAGGDAACCASNSCTHNSACIDYKSYWSSSACDENCNTNSLILKCTTSNAPYCVELFYPASITGFQCVASKSSAGHVSLSYSGGDQIIYSTATLIPVVSTSSTVTALVYTTPTASSSDYKGTNAGGIAGGVVGGVAGLALVAVGIFFFLRGKKKTEEAAAAHAGPSAHQPRLGSDGYNLDPQGQNSHYDPKSVHEVSTDGRTQAPIDTKMQIQAAPADTHRASPTNGEHIELHGLT